MNIENPFILELQYFIFTDLSHCTYFRLVVLSFPSFISSLWHLSIYKSDLTVSLICESLDSGYFLSGLNSPDFHIKQPPSSAIKATTSINTTDLHFVYLE